MFAIDKFKITCDRSKEKSNGQVNMNQIHPFAWLGIKRAILFTVAARLHLRGLESNVPSCLRFQRGSMHVTIILFTASGTHPTK
jgi:hypothetical protein